MKNKTVFIILLFLMNMQYISAQQAIAVTDSAPAIVNGLTIGYRVKSAEEKEVKDKGNFSRYNMQFYISNTSGEAKIILYKQGFTLLNDISADLVRFDCSNATGARLTNKTATLQAAPCNILADVEDKDCSSNKTVHNKRFVQIGYWIKPGQTISSNSIMIVPLNEQPRITATLLMNNASSTASTPYGQPVSSDAQSFSKIKNFWKNTYLNIQNGPAVCSEIDNEWWSAQWQLVPVSGTSFYNIKNKWKNNFISLDPSGAVVLTGFASNTSMWQLEQVANSNAVRLKNNANGSYLNIESGALQSTKIWNDAWSAQWIIEQVQ